MLSLYGGVSTHIDSVLPPAALPSRTMKTDGRIKPQRARPRLQRRWDLRYSRVAHLAARAERRIPRFAWVYLDGGTGDEVAVGRTRDAFDRVELVPRFMKGPFQPTLATTFLGVEYGAPFGTAPLGMQGLIWPGAERTLASTAADHRVAYSLSTAACQDTETIGPIAGDVGWFQLYVPADPAVGEDLLQRAEACGFRTLLLTVDVPVDARRERMRRAGLRVPFRLTPRLIGEALARPAWLSRVARHGIPRFRMMEPYWNHASAFSAISAFSAVGRASEWSAGSPDWDYLARVCENWPGPVMVKGLLHPEDAALAVEAGAAGVVVSNHGARIFDGAPPALDALPAIVDRVGGRAAVALDSGVRGGLDIARALALGADFVLLGRAFMYALGALGARGADHLIRLLKDDLTNVMTQLGCRSVADLRKVMVSRR